MTMRTLGLATFLLASLVQADYTYRYIEGEAFNRAGLEGLRDEGFTSWMAHPSGGKVAVFGRPAGGFLEYEVKDLAAGEYYLYVRCLALSTTRTRLRWDGKDLGAITHAGSSTSLRWSLPVKVTVAGNPVLRLQGGEDCTQWPYIDVILLTDQPGYVPPARDADFVSYTTPWPILTIPDQPPLTVAPLPATAPQSLPELRLDKLSLGKPVLGVNEVAVTLSSPAAREETLEASFEGEGATPASATVSLQPGTPQTLILRPMVSKAGVGVLQVGIKRGQGAAMGTYPVTIPPPATIALDEYAYPTTQKQGQWTATFHCSPDLLPKMEFAVMLTSLSSGTVGWQRKAPAAGTVQLPLDIAALPVGRYEVTADLAWDGRTALTDRREFIVFAPTVWPAWEPVQTTKAVGDTVLLNGKPFLGRLLFHTGITPQTREQGYNLVQCYGGDPDPLPSIQKCLDEAQKAGVYGTVALFNNQYLNQGTGFDLAHLERVVNAVKSHPAVWAWDLIDEPDGQDMKPPAVQAAADLIRRLDPNHIVWVNLCRNTMGMDYLGSQDLWSFDFYPFPTLTPFSFKTQWLDLSDEKLLGKKPLGTCLQTFNYNRTEQRMPSPDELRTSAWLHIIHGYKWFGYYSYYDGAPCGCLSNTPELWSYTRALNTEMVQLEELILAPGPWQPVKTDPASDRIEAREKQTGATWYVVVVSDSKEPLALKLQPTLARGSRRLLTESAAPAVVGTMIETTVRPFATQVWELQPGP